MTEIYAVDFETFYDKANEYTLSAMSTWNYVYHPKFHAYLVAIVGPDDFLWVGAPEKFDWTRLAGAQLAMHNAYFDGLVIRRLAADSIIPAFVAGLPLFDTADMAAYLRVPRNLAGAVRVLYGEVVAKETRDYMDGKTYADAVAGGREQDLLKYAGTDAVWTRRLCVDQGARWPLREQELSRLNREAGWRGLPCNVPLLETSLTTIQELHQKYLRDIPWTERLDAKGKPFKPLSVIAARQQAREDGIAMPSSVAKTSREANEWEAQYGQSHPWVAAFRHFRRVNTLLKKLENIKSNLRPDGSMAFSLLYCGANTGRPTAGFYSDTRDENEEKVNILNLPKEEQYGVNLRNLFIAPKTLWEGLCIN